MPDHFQKSSEKEERFKTRFRKEIDEILQEVRATIRPIPVIAGEKFKTEMVSVMTQVMCVIIENTPIIPEEQWKAIRVKTKEALLDYLLDYPNEKA